MSRSNRFVFALAVLGISLGFSAVLLADSGSRAVDLFGTFVSFKSGVCTVKVTKGRYAGQYDVNIPDNIPVLVYTSAGHPQTRHSPDGFDGVAAGTPIEINIDSRQKVLRVCIGDTKPSKSGGSKSSK